MSDSGASEPPGGRSREYQALLMLKAGLGLEEVAARLPNHHRRKPGEYGVSPSIRDAVIRLGLRLLTTAIARNHRPEEVPADLWPPPEVREGVRAEAEASRRRPGRSPLQDRALRAWLRAEGEAARGLRRLATARPTR